MLVFGFDNGKNVIGQDEESHLVLVSGMIVCLRPHSLPYQIDGSMDTPRNGHSGFKINHY